MLQKLRNAVFFSMIRVSGQSKSRPVKAAGVESCEQRRNQKLYAPVVKSAFWSENVENTSGPKPFLKFWCWKNARRCGEKAHYEIKMLKKLKNRKQFLKFSCRRIARGCGEKHILNSKCQKIDGSGALFVVMSKKWTPLLRKAHFEVKMYKTSQQRTGFWTCDVEKLHEPVARSAFVSQYVQNTCVLVHFFKFRCRTIS